jgi:hypothetical protein
MLARAFVVVSCLLAACKGAPPPATRPVGEPVARTASPSRGIVTRDDGRSYAVVQLRRHDSECSNAGGEHYQFEIDEPARAAKRVAHGGGHGVQLDLVSRRGHYFVAELMVSAPCDGSYCDPGTTLDTWCIQPRTFDAEILRLLPAHDLESARQALAIVAERGLPPAAATLVAPTGRETIAVARVRDGDRQRMQFHLEPIDGSAPATIGLESTRLRPHIGDFLVVASVGEQVTRVLLADDRAAALRWAEIVRGEGWPPEVILATHERNPAIARWTVFGLVVEGPPGCGLSIEGRLPRADVGLSKLSAAAPPGMAVGDTAMAVVTLRFTDDACGHNLRAVRVYRNPPTPSWPDDGSRVPSIPISE